jgi:Tat protein secretion system quality control protein TatD with DNase activity
MSLLLFSMIAHLKDLPVETIATQTTLNACRLFGLESPA